VEVVVAKTLGLRYVMAVNRGRTALELALFALDLPQDSEVLIPAYICASVPEAVARRGFRPVRVPVGKDLHLDPESLEAAVTPRTRAAIVPHLFGHSAQIERIVAWCADRGLRVIDDAAQCFGNTRGGRMLGSFGDCGIVCCGPGKLLSGPAGGFFVTSNQELFERARTFPLESEAATTVLRRVGEFWFWRRARRYTWLAERLAERMGYTSLGASHHSARLAELDAALVGSQIVKRSAHAARLRQAGLVLRDALESRYPGQVAGIWDEETVPLKIALLLRPGKPFKRALAEFRGDGVEAVEGYRPDSYDGWIVGVEGPMTTLWVSVNLSVPLRVVRRLRRTTT
jgi:dTDP-4-amino-4,6-dideoxygalactose transaminase